MMFGPGVILQEFDPTTNTVTSATPPPDRGNPYPIDYVNLPNGQVMITAGDNDWIYTPDTGPDDAWRPAVSSVVFDAGTTYTLTGTQISGLINGADEGDDMTMAENYPIVYLKDTAGNVYFCRTFAFSSMMPSKGAAAETCQFTTPAGLPNGSYDLYVSAVGVPSKDPFPFTVGVGGTSDGGTSTGGGADAGGGSDASTKDGGGTGGSDASTGGGSGSSSGGVTSGSSGGSGQTSGGSGSNGGTSGSSRASGSAGSTTGAETTGDNHAGCGCRVAGSDGAGNGLAALLGFAGVLGGVARRRRRTA
jgi:MYXO-CTERM domain-containing protein